MTSGALTHRGVQTVYPSGVCGISTLSQLVFAWHSPQNTPVSNKPSVMVGPWRLSFLTVCSETSLPPFRTTLLLPSFCRFAILRWMTFQHIAVLFLRKPHFLNCRSYWPLLWQCQLLASIENHDSILYFITNSWASFMWFMVLLSDSSLVMYRVRSVSL